MQDEGEDPNAITQSDMPTAAATLTPSVSLAEAHMKMADLHRIRWDVRRQDSWKVTLALWTILAFAIVQGETSIPNWAVISAAIAVPALHVFWWINPIETRHSADVENMFHFMESARFLLGEDIEVREAVNEAPKYDPLAFVGAWTGLFQAAVTALLAGAFAMSSVHGWFNSPNIAGGVRNADTAEQPHATGTCAAGVGPAMLGQDAKGNDVPVPGN